MSNAQISNDSIHQVESCLQKCRLQLKSWCIATGSNVKKLIKEKTDLMAHLQENDDGSNAEDMKRIQTEINALLEQEEIAWQQRAKQHWLKDGDNNTRFFHLCANQRRKSNFLACVEDTRGNLYQTHEEINGVFMDHYRKIYSTSTPTGIEDLLHNFNTRIPDACQADLEKPYTREEDRHALFQMDPLKSPRPDGFPACFYQKILASCW